jgi:hypothetical protein
VFPFCPKSARIGWFSFTIGPESLLLLFLLWNV